MISVEKALSECLALTRPLEIDYVPLSQAGGRVLAQPLRATRDQPPFASSAMDGYAMRAEDVSPGVIATVIGEAAAGHEWIGEIGPGKAVRIFTGAPVPKSAGRVVIQEDVTRIADQITLGDNLDAGTHIRPAGGDFINGHTLDAPRRLRPADIALIAAMNIPKVPVTRRPIVAIIPTGDELVQPGSAPRNDQIIASNSYGLKVMFDEVGADARLLPIASDTVESLSQMLALAKGADLIVTIGGASVGDHDLVARVADAEGLSSSFYKVAMRPGKPLMAGKIGSSALIGLPGNPVSSMICGMIFILPMLKGFLGLPTGPMPRQTARLAVDLPANGPREHYMRACVVEGAEHPLVTPAGRQDSSLLTVLAGASALMVRPAHQGPLSAGSLVDILKL